MLRSELVARVANQNPHLYAKDVEAVVNTILDRIETALIQGDRIELRGFGTFEIRHHERGMRRNPRTGAAVEVGERASIHFKPSRVMRERLKLGAGDLAVKAEHRLRAS
jgi:integration host factor subunit beta